MVHRRVVILRREDTHAGIGFPELVKAGVALTCQRTAPPTGRITGLWERQGNPSSEASLAHGRMDGLNQRDMG